MRCAPRAHLAPARGQGGRAALQLLGRGGGPGGGPGDRLRPGDGIVGSLGNGPSVMDSTGMIQIVDGPTVLWQQRWRQGEANRFLCTGNQQISTNDIQITLW